MRQALPAGLETPAEMLHLRAYHMGCAGILSLLSFELMLVYVCTWSAVRLQRLPQEHRSLPKIAVSHCSSAKHASQ